MRFYECELCGNRISEEEYIKDCESGFGYCYCKWTNDERIIGFMKLVNEYICYNHFKLI